METPFAIILALSLVVLGCATRPAAVKRPAKRASLPGDYTLNEAKRDPEDLDITDFFLTSAPKDTKLEQLPDFAFSPTTDEDAGDAERMFPAVAGDVEEVIFGPVTVYVVTKELARVHAKPSAAAKVVRTLVQGERVAALPSDDWVRIDDGQFVDRRALAVDEATARSLQTRNED